MLSPQSEESVRVRNRPWRLEHPTRRATTTPRRVRQLVDLAGARQLVDLAGARQVVDLAGARHLVDLAGARQLVDLARMALRRGGKPPPSRLIILL